MDTQEQAKETAYQYNDYAREFRQRSQPYWATALDFAAGSGPAPKQPYQVEIHPQLEGAPVCLLRCIDCHGQFQRRKGGLSAQAYYQLLEDLQIMGVPSVVYSGIYSDPTTDSDLLCELLRRGGPHWGVKLHTYGLGLNEDLCRAIVFAATVGPPRSSYLTISKVTTDPQVYQEMCRPTIDPEVALAREEANLRRLFTINQEAHAPLTVHLNCRVTQANGSPEQLANLLLWLRTTPPWVQLRFTPDYVPTGASSAYCEKFMRTVYLDGPTVLHRLRDATLQTNLNPTSRISFRDVDGTCYQGPRCYSSLLLAAVSTTGCVYPCQSIASAVHQPMAYGNLYHERFPTIWQRFTSTWAQRPSCVCTPCPAACEKQLNLAFQEELG